MTITETVTQPSVDDLANLLIEEEQAEKDGKLTHIITPEENPHIWEEGMTAKEVVTIARLTGQHLVALCGFTWVPKNNPDNFDICETCMDVANFRMRMAGQ